MKGSWILLGLGLLVLLRMKSKTSRLSENFTLDELTQTSTGLDNTPNDQQIENLQLLVERVLQPIRDLLGRPVIITSGFRSEAVNRNVGGDSDSQHKTGSTADFKVSGMATREAFEKIKSSRIPYDQLIYEKDWETGGEWIHVSSSTNPRKQALTAFLNDGDAVYSYA